MGLSSHNTLILYIYPLQYLQPYYPVLIIVSCIPWHIPISCSLLCFGHPYIYIPAVVIPLESYIYIYVRMSLSIAFAHMYSCILTVCLPISLIICAYIYQCSLYDSISACTCLCAPICF